MSTTDLTVHEDWSTPQFGLDPLAPATGPFVHRRVLETWHRHRGGDTEVRLVESADALLPLCAADGTIRFLGEPDLTDYHSPLGQAEAVAALTAAYVSTLDPGATLEFDSLPTEAADALETGLEAAGSQVDRREHEVAAVMALPPTFDEWLAAIGKKERHEVRRKRRRFNDDLGPPEMVRADGPEAVDTFIAMHRRASGDKGAFMTPEIAALFRDLHSGAGAVIDLLHSSSGTPVAAAFGFEDEHAYYLYNSAYDPAARSASPGIVMLASLIERAIAAGRTTFDFLKGDETYKFRHGAEPRPLYALSTTVPA